MYWFALDDTQPLFAFAGLWCDWRGSRGTKKEPVEGKHRLYAFLTTEVNGVVETIHSKAMPAILATPEEFDAWLSAPIEESSLDASRAQAQRESFDVVNNWTAV